MCVWRCVGVSVCAEEESWGCGSVRVCVWVWLCACVMCVCANVGICERVSVYVCVLL